MSTFVHGTPVDDPLYAEDDLPVRDSLAREHRVATITGYERALGAAQAARSEYRSELLAYDRGGRRLSYQRFDRVGEPVRRRVYEAGELVAELAYDRSGEIDYRIDVLRERTGWSEKQLRSASGAVELRVIAERDDSGRLLRAVFLDPGGEQLRAERYAYDEHGRLARVDAGALGFRTYDYGPGGELVRRTVVAPGASGLGDVVELEHDARGLPVRSVRPHVSETNYAFGYGER